MEYDLTLPIAEKKEDIQRLIHEHQVVILCGETGSGKSTQLPKMLLEMGRGAKKVIGHTQPRRIAARSVAARIAEELGVPLGTIVGYKIRFQDHTQSATRVKLMTDGILLAESRDDRLFRQYDTIILDEAHERSLNIDFLIGLFRRILPQRRDLKLIITSATIDAARFAHHFSQHGTPAPVIEVAGRSYPIDIRYLNDDVVSRENEANEDKDDIDRILDAVDSAARLGKGDMLIFLPTERDILETAKKLRSHSIPGDDTVRKTEILPLYARLSIEQQQKIFKSHNHRRIVLATNVAESSLTVPGIRYVIDTGTARIARYSSRSKTQRLPIEPVSRASADQRAGRCGRVGPGVCFRLYTAEDYHRRERYTTPEIQRTNLASVILQSLVLRLGDIAKFPFLDPPKPVAIQDGYRTLVELGAITDHSTLTPLGHELSRLPVDPRIARMIVAARSENVLRDVLIIAAVLEIQDPRERPLEQQKKADEAHQKFYDEKSDFLSYLKMWDFYHHLKETLSQNQLRKACQQNFLSYNRMREWSDIHTQLLRIVRETTPVTSSATFSPVSQKRGVVGTAVSNPALTLGAKNQMEEQARYDAIHRSILSGFLSGIAVFGEKMEYTSAGGGKFIVWPGSGLARKQIQWVVAAERIETTKRYLRCCAKISPDWVESLAKHLVKRTYSDPHWCQETGYVHAFERVSLFGLILVPRRRVQYGSKEPDVARRIFIEDALVRRQLDTKCEFYEYNEEVFADALAREAKLRRHEFSPDEQKIREFYIERIPEGVYDKRTLEKWFSSLDTTEKNRLYMTLTDICGGDVNHEEMKTRYPDTIPSPDGGTAKMEYRYSPGDDGDGVTLVVTPRMAMQMAPASIGWLVPGLLQQKIEAMLRSLPKDIRRHLVPVPDTAKKILADLKPSQVSLEEQLAKEVTRLVGARVLPSHFDTTKIPPELVVNFRVMDENGNIVAEGRKLEEVRKNLKNGNLAAVLSANPNAPSTAAKYNASTWCRDDVKKWDFGDLPEIIESGDTTGFYSPVSYPTLMVSYEKVSKEGVFLRLLSDRTASEFETRRGVMRLFVLRAGKSLDIQSQWIPDFGRLRIFSQPLPEFDLKKAVTDLMAARAIRMEEMKIPRNSTMFESLVQEGTMRIGEATVEVTKWLKPFLVSFHEARLSLEKHNSPAWQSTFLDVKEQIRRLVAPHFITRVPWRWLKEYPRYLTGVASRFDRLVSSGVSADQLLAKEIDKWWQQYELRRERLTIAGIVDEELETFRWMVEEYRISLFAQKLGTSVTISAKRLEKQLAKVREL